MLHAPPPNLQGLWVFARDGTPPDPGLPQRNHPDSGLRPFHRAPAFALRMQLRTGADYFKATLRTSPAQPVSP